MLDGLWQGDDVLAGGKERVDWQCSTRVVAFAQPSELENARGVLVEPLLPVGWSARASQLCMKNGSMDTWAHSVAASKPLSLATLLLGPDLEFAGNLFMQEQRGLSARPL